MIDISQDKELLVELYKKSKDGKEKNRYHALSVVALGYSIAEVAKIFFCDEDTISNWVNYLSTSR